MSSTVHIMPTQDGRDVVYCAYSAREPNQAVWRTTCEPLDAGLPPKKLLSAGAQRCNVNTTYEVSRKAIFFSKSRRSTRRSLSVCTGVSVPCLPVYQYIRPIHLRVVHTCMYWTESRSRGDCRVSTCRFFSSLCWAQMMASTYKCIKTCPQAQATARRWRRRRPPRLRPFSKRSTANGPPCGSTRTRRAGNFLSCAARKTPRVCCCLRRTMLVLNT